MDKVCVIRRGLLRTRFYVLTFSFYRTSLDTLLFVLVYYSVMCISLLANSRLGTLYILQRFQK